MPRFAANLTMLFTELPFEQRFHAAKEAGFDAVEMVSPYVLPAQIIREIAEDAGVQIVLFNTPVFDWDSGGRGVGAVPGQEGLFRAGFEAALDYAEVLKPRHIHIMAGNARGDEARVTFLSNLRWATMIGSGQNLTIEPINPFDMPDYFLNDFDLAAEILASVRAPNLSLQFDAYHAQRITGDALLAWERYGPLAGHIQIAGVPGRHEPAGGDIDYPTFFKRLDAAGYTGWIGAEYNPSGRTAEGLNWRPAPSDPDV